MEGTLTFHFGKGSCGVEKSSVVLTLSERMVMSDVEEDTPVTLCRALISEGVSNVNASTTAIPRAKEADLAVSWRTCDSGLPSVDDPHEVVEAQEGE